MRSLFLGLVLLVSVAEAGKRKPPSPDPADTAAILLGRALQSDEAYTELATLCDTIGHRLSGTPALDRAIDWAAAELAADGLSVSREPVQVRRWVRGPASLRLVAPVADDLTLLALGDSVATPPGGLEADVLVVTSFEDLEARSDLARGRIVVWDVPFTDYGATVGYRYASATRASTHGAVASLVRSIAPTGHDTPHTGQQRYGDGVEPIPTAAISAETAERLHRMQDRGLTPRLALQIEARTEGEVTSHNVVGELRGRELPDEVVVLGCHLDSWDVGQGAQDDGAGCVTIMEAGALLASLPQAPRRTVRVVLYTNEENGLGGGRTYAAAHKGERIVAAVEDDTGSGAPLGFQVHALKAAPDPSEDPVEDPERAERVLAALQPHLPWLAPAGAGSLTPGGSGADIGPLVEQGTIGFGLAHDMTGYWPIHHTEADTFDKVDPALVKRNVAAMTVFAWILAELGPTGESTP
jgi:carboxypeptidase Q